MLVVEVTEEKDVGGRGSKEWESKAFKKKRLSVFVIGRGINNTKGGFKGRRRTANTCNDHTAQQKGVCGDKGKGGVAQEQSTFRCPHSSIVF
jgi:hypothetical protein